MEASEKETYRHELLRLKIKALKILDLERHYAREENPLQESRDTGDFGKATVDLEIDLLSQETAAHILEQVERALEKIESDTYDSCDRCRRTIDQKRLEALPYTLLCVHCQEETEKRRMK